jgi:hypothetical protein
MIYAYQKIADKVYHDIITCVTICQQHHKWDECNTQLHIHIRCLLTRMLLSKRIRASRHCMLANNITWDECIKLHTHFCLLIHDDRQVVQYVNNTNEMNVILIYTSITVACRHIIHHWVNVSGYKACMLTTSLGMYKVTHPRLLVDTWWACKWNILVSRNGWLGHLLTTTSHGRRMQTHPNYFVVVAW